MQKTVKELIKEYYDAFNAEDDEWFLSLMHPEIIHDINQGAQEIGIPLFGHFLKEMRKYYSEKVEELIIFSDEKAQRGAAEFYVRGRYEKTAPSFIPATGQTYYLPVGAFFACQNGLIKRVTTYYNVKDWIKMVSP